MRSEFENKHHADTGDADDYDDGQCADDADTDADDD